MAALPEVYAAAIRLRDGGWSDSAIGEELGIDPVSVEPLLRIAAAKLARAQETPDDA